MAKESSWVVQYPPGTRRVLGIEPEQKLSVHWCFFIPRVGRLTMVFLEICTSVRKKHLFVVVVVVVVAAAAAAAVVCCCCCRLKSSEIT